MIKFFVAYGLSTVLCVHTMIALEQRCKDVSQVRACYAALKDRFLPQKGMLYVPTKKAIISGHNVKQKGDLCPFCIQIKETNDRKNLILGRTSFFVIALSFYPFFDGHILLIPHRHVGTLGELSKEERAELMELTMVATQMLQEVLHAEGVNIGINIGRAAGASIPDHLHIQIVPRWEQYRDTYIQIYENSSVISHSLPEMYDILAPKLAPKLLVFLQVR